MSEGLKKQRVMVPSSADSPAWEGNRDTGKMFLITEMPAAQAERWAWRLVIALKGSGSEVPEAAMNLGMVGIAYAGLNSFLRASIDLPLFESLMDEMMTCVQVVRDPRHPDVATAIASDDDIQEVQTRGWLRSEVLKLHTNFSVVDVVWKWISETRPTIS